MDTPLRSSSLASFGYCRGPCRSVDFSGGDAGGCPGGGGLIAPVCGDAGYPAGGWLAGTGGGWLRWTAGALLDFPGGGAELSDRGITREVGTGLRATHVHTLTHYITTKKRLIALFFQVLSVQINLK